MRWEFLSLSVGPCRQGGGLASKLRNPFSCCCCHVVVVSSESETGTRGDGTWLRGKEGGAEAEGGPVELVGVGVGEVQAGGRWERQACRLEKWMG